MNLNEYQKEAEKTAIYPSKGKNIFYPTLGLTGEAGEVADKIKKIFRDKNGSVSEEDKYEIKKELGDVLWYLAILSNEFGISLEDVAVENIKKIKSRLKRGVIGGSGDNR